MRFETEIGSVLAGGGEMGTLMRSIDWRESSLGPVEGWPQSLRTALSILLDTGFPMYIAWGSNFTQFYNDGYRPILGSTKHPAAMGRSTRETFSEIWDIIGPMFEGVMEGKPTTLVDFLLPLDRHGFAEECYFIFSYSPIREEGGRVGGVLVTVTETTPRILGERRLKTTQALAAETREARTVGHACAIAARVLACNTADVPFAQVYLVSADRQTARLAARSGTAPEETEEPEIIRLDSGHLAPAMLAACGAMWQVSASGVVPVECGPTLPTAGRTLVLPIVHPGARHPVGLLVVGTSSRLILDEAYCNFLSLAASQIGTAIAGAKALEDAAARTEALAELDRAKTAFFTNVSHEFRTPLTLMIGPTEEALGSPELALQGENLQSVYRNQLRLLKLVNTLLDFSRIEAGRANARFEPTDLAALTVNLASAFRSAIERAGLEFIVVCPTLPEPVYVDREMWEKIVLNLLSNAFKFTFQGSICLTLEWLGTHVEMHVRDTGGGIAAADVGRVFERFYRIEHAAGRTHEGSGIGLALVRELVSLHGGAIEAASTLGQGSDFTVRLNSGYAHLPQELVVIHGGELAPEPSATDTPHPMGAARPYVEEALRWLPTDSPESEVSAPSRAPQGPSARACILVADDNADMRNYLERLLSPRFQVEAVSNGKAAFEIARKLRPDVIVSDVMMPGLDGFELVQALRAADATHTIPVILLSARAGEEARIEGLQAGADDYLVKPFSARELVARVEAQLVRLKVRALEEANAVRLANVFALAPVGIAILRGADHVYEFANRAYLALVQGREVVGRTIRDALPELEGQGIYELLDDVYNSAQPFVGRSISAQLLRMDGIHEEGFFDLVYQPLFDDAGAVSGIAVVAFDVTELTKARREAEAASRAKDEFLAMLGHELRNPLAPIVTALHLMRLRNLTGAEREREIIERQVKHVVSLVDDLLDVSRITRGQLQLRREPVDLADVVAKAIEMTMPAIELKGHALEVAVPRGLTVNADAARLAQVLTNLVTNAAKYTEEGGKIGVTGRSDKGHAEIAVTDSGRGISRDMLPRVFDLFSQERQEIDRREGGLGLGLAIVKSLVQAHGGTVSVYSQGKGRGAQFVVRLPLFTAPGGPTEAAAVPESSMQVHSQSTGRLRIMVVDDNADAAELLELSLRTAGHTTQVAHDGPGALNALCDFRPDVVLLDLGLPVLDGFEVARRIRALPNMAHVALVAITGYGRDVDRQRTRDAGFDKHMVKPVDPESLDQWLSLAAQRLRAGNV